MSIKRALIRTLDRRGGRTLLGLLSTLYLKRITNQDASIFFDDIWMHRVGVNYFVDSARFDFSQEKRSQWATDFKAFCHDAHDYWFYAYKPKPGHVIINIGAGIGSGTLVFSRAVGNEGTVVAIEPHPVTFLALEKLCKWNNLNNVILRNCAIMHQDCKVYIENNEAYESNTVSLRPDYTRLKEPIVGISLDDLCKELGIDRIDYIKMNVEGAERYVINGMTSIIDKVSCICIACHDFKADEGWGEENRTRDLVIAFLRAHKFQVITRDEHPVYYVRDHIWGCRNATGP